MRRSAAWLRISAWIFAPVVLLLMTAALPAHAQSESIIHNFAGSTTDGDAPASRLISDSAGNLYGTTEAGGSSNGGSNVINNCPEGCGTVFELVNSNGTSTTYKENVLYNFTGFEGSAPGPLLRDSAGDLFGVTTNGGDYGYGTVFELVNSSGTYTEHVLYSFSDGADGGFPKGALIRDLAGDLFGTTSIGGDYGYGTVFELVRPPKATDPYTEKVLHSFDLLTDGAGPQAGLVMDGSGNLYGTTASGGDPGSCVTFNGSPCGTHGTVFKLSPPPPGPGTWTETTLHVFLGYLPGYSTQTGNVPTVIDGAYPEAAVILDSSGNLYGTTSSGGNSSNNGTVFELTYSGGTYTEKILYTFNGGSDGGSPDAPVIRDSSGNLYGTTSRYGDSTGGTAFELSTLSGTPVLRTLHSFSGNPDGKYPTAGLLIDSSGNLYGTTRGGGSADFGTAYKITYCASHNTAIKFTSSPNPADAGSNIVLTASVKDTCGDPAFGTVEFFYGSTSLGTATLDSTGSGSVTVEDADSLGIGTFTLTVTYTPSFSDFQSSTGSINQTVNETGAATTGGNIFTGNQTITGTVTATSFVGDGFGLTNLNPASLASGTAGIDISGNAATATTADNALALGGHSSSYFATLSANSFTGSQTVNGSVTALSFSGNGSSLTSLNPGALTSGTAGINISGNAATATLAESAATATLAATATNALALGGHPPTYFATLGANSFTGNQSVAGNLTATGSLTGASISTDSLTIGGGTPITGHFSQTFPGVTFNTKMHPTTCTVWTQPMSSAADGDTVVATLSSSLMSANIVFSAWATTGAVNVRICNPTGKPTQLGAGSIRIDLWKH